MITKITGRITTVAGDAMSLAVGALEYEILIPEFVRRQLQHQVGDEATLHTIQYLDGDPSRGRMTPRLVGFLHSIEREFFELFCQVDGVGVRKALRAMVRPVQEVASLIEEQDAKGLSALPGIGPATADRVVAKLRRKVPKFALLVGRDSPGGGSVEHDLVAEVYEILCTLGHSEADARRLLDGVTGGRKKFKDVESLLHAVYESRSGQ